MGAVAWGPGPALRFPSPLIEPDVPVAGICSRWGLPNLAQSVGAAFGRLRQINDVEQAKI